MQDSEYVLMFNQNVTKMSLEPESLILSEDAPDAFYKVRETFSLGRIILNSRRKTHIT